MVLKKCLIITFFIIFFTHILAKDHDRDVIINGSFISGTDGWEFIKKSGKPTGSWDPLGYANGGAAKISSEIGKNKSGNGYWQQTIATTIQAGSTIKLSYAWKKSYQVVEPTIQNIYITLVKPNGEIVNIDEQLGKPTAYNVWFTVINKDVSTHFNITGIYKIRLRFVYKTGNNSRAQAFAWFDEVKLLVTPPIGQWVERASTPSTGGYGEAVCGTDSFIYIIRCLNAASIPQFWRYNFSQDSWDSLSISGLPIGAFRNGTTLVWDNSDNLYALGGARYTDSDRRLFFRYSISEDYWYQLPETPAPQGAGNALAWSSYDNNLYAILGSNQHGTAFARYNPFTNTWSLLSPPPGGTDDGASLVSTGDRYLFALRGEYYEEIPLQDFWRYDILKDTWEILSPIPQENGVGDGASLLWNGNGDTTYTYYIYALGGGDVNENPGYKFYRYSIRRNEWENLPDIPYPVGYYNGNRLAFTYGYIHYWQGTPSTFPGGGNRFARFEFSSYGFMMWSYENIKEKEYIKKFNILPNPIKDFAKLTYIPNTEIKELKIYTVDGRLVKNIPILKKENPIILDLTDLKSGYYQLQIKTNENIFAKAIRVIK